MAETSAAELVGEPRRNPLGRKAQGLQPGGAARNDGDIAPGNAQPGRDQPLERGVGLALFRHGAHFRGEIGAAGGILFDVADGVRTGARRQPDDQQNALSVNVRNRGGGLIFKYGLGGSNSVIANCQGSIDRPVTLSGLSYRLKHPYDLISYYDGRGYHVGIRDVLTGQERWSGRRNNTKGGGPAACLDLDQENGRGPVYLGKVEVWLDL